MVFVKVSETYDLSTVVNKMGMVAIHTPKPSLIKNMWQGLCDNYRYMKFVKCDIAMACASTLPADPLQIGVEAGDIAPQDMFNPILYKAVSNDSYNTFLNRLRYLKIQDGLSDGSVESVNDPVFIGRDGDSVDQFAMYYSLLSEPDSWAKADPRHGLKMRGLFPVVFSLVSSVGNISPASPSVNSNVYSLGERESMSISGTVLGNFFRGRSMRMPRVPTVAYVDMNGKAVDFSPAQAYIAVLILPPAKLNVLYYRLKVTWTVEFSEPRPLTEISDYSGIASIGTAMYGSDYVEQSSTADVVTSAVDATGATVTKIMEGVS